MNTPNHATDAQIDELWEMLQLETARNFVSAYRSQQQARDESESGYDPREHAKENVK
jgi:hypothetical protein